MKISKPGKWTWTRMRKWMRRKTRVQQNQNNQGWNNGQQNQMQKAIMCYRCRRWGNHTTRNCYVSGCELTAMEEQAAPTVMINRVSSYDNMRVWALNF